MSDSAAAAIELRGLTVRYHARGPEAVAGVDLRVEPGRILALVGESGSGKSSIALAILRLLPTGSRTTGGMLVDGVEVTELRGRALTRWRAQDIGYVPQDPALSLNPMRRIRSQLFEVLKRQGHERAALEREAIASLEQVGVADPARALSRFPHELSGGEKQRVLIAMALAGNPRAIIADEPTSALDVIVQRQVMDRLAEISRARGIGVLFITHDLGLARDYADDAIVLRDGLVVDRGPLVGLAAAPAPAYTAELIAASPALRRADSLGSLDSPGAHRIAARDARPAGGTILTLSEIAYRYPGGATAIDKVTIDIAPGRTHCLVGESGSGKSTLLRIAAGLLAPDHGSVRFRGEDLAALATHARSRLQRDIQVVYQNPARAFDPRMSVGAQVVEPLVIHHRLARRLRERRVTELLDLVGLPTRLAHARPRELSGGQLQRAAIARSLALEPALLLLDEPVSALDPIAQQHVLDLLGELQHRLGLTYLFVTHDLAVVAEIGDDVTVLRRSEHIATGTVADIFANAREGYVRDLIDAIPGNRPRRRAGEPA